MQRTPKHDRYLRAEHKADWLAFLKIFALLGAGAVGIAALSKYADEDTAIQLPLIQPLADPPRGTYR
jgi:hypothetical protein